MDIILERIETNEELIKLLKAKDKLKRKYDELRFSKKSVDYRYILNIKNELEIMNHLINNYVKNRDNIKELKCIKDTIIKADKKEIEIPVSVNNLCEYDIFFNGYVASHGFVDIYYDSKNDIICAKNKAKLKDMRKPLIEHMCKITTNLCFYPGNYLIQEGDTIGIALEKQKVKTLH